MKRAVCLGLLLLGGCARVGWQNVEDLVPAASQMEWKRSSVPIKSLWSPDGRRLWAVGDLGLVLYTEDAYTPIGPPAGIQWTNFTSATAGTLHAIVGNADASRLWAAGDGGILLASTDGGQRWEPQDNPEPADLFALYRESGSGMLFAAGAGGTLLRSRDDGQSWQRLPSGTSKALFALAGAADDSRVCAAGEAGSFVCSLDGGETWTAQGTGAQEDLLALFASADGHSLWAAGRDGRLLLSRDGGERWDKVETGTPETLWALHGRADGSRLWAAGTGGALLRSDDSGRSWEKEPSGTSKTLRALLSTADGQTAYALGDGGLFLRRTPERPWGQLGSAPREALHALFLAGEGSPLWAAGRLGALLSFEPGGPWRRHDSKTRGTLLSLFGSQDGSRLCAVGRTGAVVRSLDGGRNWEPSKSREDGAYLLAVHGDAQADTLWAVGGLPSGLERTAEGILMYSTSLGGDEPMTWTSKMRHPHVLRSVFSTENGGQIWVVGDQGTLFQSTDGGDHWVPRAGAGQVNLQAVRGTPDGSQIWIAGAGGTILHGTADRDTLEPQRSGTAEDLVGLHVAGGGNQVWAIGRDGLVLRSADGGKNWYPETAGSAEGCTLHAITGTPEGDRAWAVDDSGDVYLGTAGKSLPRITEIRLAHTAIGDRLELRLDQPDGEAYPDLQAELWAATDGQRPGESMAPVDATLNRPAGGSDVWSFEVDVTQPPLKLKPGDPVHFEVVLAAGGTRRAMTLPTLKFARWDWWKKLGIPLGLLGLFILLALLFEALSRVRPLWLLKARRALLGWSDNLPLSKLGPSVRFAVNFLPMLWLKSNRVLDAWIRDRTAGYREYFESRPMARAAGSYLPLPVRVLEGPGGPGALIPKPAPGNFARYLAAGSALIELVGPRGSGKTSLAVQMARWALDGRLHPTDSAHPMLPILIEEDTENLVDEVRKILQASLHEELEPEILHALLRRQRLLIVVDAISERPPAVRNHVRRLHGTQPVNALLVTGRGPADFQAGGVVRLEVQALPAAQKVALVVGLLKSLDPFELEPRELIDFAHRIADLIPTYGESGAPPLLVRCLVERAVALPPAKRGGTELEPLAVEAHFDFLTREHPSRPLAEYPVPDVSLTRAAETLGRLALGKNFVPKEFFRSTAEEELRGSGLEAPAAAGVIDRFIDDGILEAHHAMNDWTLAFRLPSLAEFLAAMSLADRCAGDPAAWQALRKEIAGQGAAELSRKLDLLCRAYSHRLGWACASAPDEAGSNPRDGSGGSSEG